MSSPPLPAEMLDSIADFLHDTRDALKSCCLVSKTWVPRTRKHLFAHVAFESPGKLQSWKATFPDPSTSPARYTKSLFIEFSRSDIPTDVEEGGWIPTFSGVVHFAMKNFNDKTTYETLVPFQGFSPAIKSFCLTSPTIPFPQFLDFIRSFPLLEDLSVKAWSVDVDRVFEKQSTPTQPTKSPAFTGTLELSFIMGMGVLASGILRLPGGIHFRRLDLTWTFDQDISLTTVLVERCGPTLEYLDIGFGVLGTPPSKPIDLSKATRLKEVVFPCDSNPKWIITTLRTITHDHKSLKWVSLKPPNTHRFLDPDPVPLTDLIRVIGETAYQEWLELDRTLTQLWESHSIRLKILHNGRILRFNDYVKCAEILLPEVTNVGIADLIRQKEQ